MLRFHFHFTIIPCNYRIICNIFNTLASRLCFIIIRQFVSCFRLFQMLIYLCLCFIRSVKKSLESCSPGYYASHKPYIFGVLLMSLIIAYISYRNHKRSTDPSKKLGFSRCGVLARSTNLEKTVDRILDGFILT